MKLDLGCGYCKKEGYFGVDIEKNEGVDLVLDIGKDKFPWEDESVEDIHCSHAVEHLEPEERIHFINECYRVLKKGSKLFIQVPYWASARAYGDLTHKWPPVTEFWPLYLNKTWREKQAPHNTGYTCDFDFEAGLFINKDFATKFANLKETAGLFINGADDLVITLTKR